MRLQQVSQIPGRPFERGPRQEAVEMTKEENPQTQERDSPLSWKAQTPRFPHSHRTATAAVLASTPQSKPQPKFALLATFPTYPQIPRRRHSKRTSSASGTTTPLPGLAGISTSGVSKPCAP